MRDGKIRNQRSVMWLLLMIITYTCVVSARCVEPVETKIMMSSPLRPQPHMTVDIMGNVLLVWEHIDIWVAMWNGEIWEFYPQPQSEVMFARDRPNPIIGADIPGQPYVAYLSNNIIYDKKGIFVEKWNGTTWAPLGKPLLVDANSDTLEMEFSMVVDNDGMPVVLWLENLNNPRMYMVRWNGMEWIRIDTTDIEAEGILSKPTLAIGKNNEILVSWLAVDEYKQQQYIKVAKQVNNNWVIIETRGYAEFVCVKDIRNLTLKQNNRWINLQWIVDDSEIVVALWNGEKWQFHYPPIDDKAIHSATNLVTDDGVIVIPWVAWATDGYRYLVGRMSVLREGTWSNKDDIYGQPLDGRSDVWAISIEEGADGTIYLAWVAWFRDNQEYPTINIKRMKACALDE